MAAMISYERALEKTNTSYKGISFALGSFTRALEHYVKFLTGVSKVPNPTNAANAANAS